MKLHHLDHIPEALLDAESRQLADILPGPTLLHIAGQQEPPLFVSTLLHGNEVTSWLAVRELLNGYHHAGATLPRSLYLLIGNVDAAAQGLRKLPGQMDYNRIWAGGETAEHRLADQVLGLAREVQPFAFIDVHNNTGRNPHYACVNRVDAPFLNLARTFSRTLVYFTEPHEVISNAFAQICPSVTIEAGLSGAPDGTRAVLSFLQEALRMDAISHQLQPHDETSVYHTVGRITVPEHASISFDAASGAEFRFVEDLDALNFSVLDSGTVIGNSTNPALRLQVEDLDQCDVSDLYLDQSGPQIRTRRSFIPAMFTRDTRVIQQDCLGYVMEPYPLQEPSLEPV